MLVNTIILIYLFLDKNHFKTDASKIPYSQIAILLKFCVRTR